MGAHAASAANDITFVIRITKRVSSLAPEGSGCLGKACTPAKRQLTCGERKKEKCRDAG